VTIAPGAYVCEERLQLVGEISIGIKFSKKTKKKTGSIHILEIIYRK
jgi:hypothetical protein